MASHSPLHVLLLEDDPDDVLLLQIALQQAGFDADLQTVETRAAFEAALHPGIDLVLSDHVLPQFSAIDALRLLQESNLDVPFIIVSGLIDDETAVEAIRLGADDYVLKDRLPRLGPAIRKVLDEYRLRHTQDEARQALKESHHRFEALAANMPGLIYQLQLLPDGTLHFPYVSEDANPIHGFSAAAVMADASLILGRIHPADRPGFDASLHRSATTVTPWHWEGRLLLNDTLAWLQCAARPRRLADKGILWDGIALDITEQKQTQAAYESEKDFTASALNVLPDIFFVIDDAGHFLRWNRRFREVTGYSDADIAALRPADLFTRADRAAFLQTMRQVHADEPSVIEASIQTLDGTRIPYEFTVAVLQASADGLSGVCAIGRDLTQRKRTEEALKHSEEKYHSLFESASDAIFLIKDGRVVDCNARSLELFGCDRAMLIDQPPRLFSPPTQPDGRSSKAVVQEKIQAALAGAPQRFEWIHQRYNGQPFDAEFHLSRVVTDETVYLQALVRNITERKRYEEGLIEAKEKAEEMNRLKDAFLTNMSHEVRTPLTAILGFSELLTGLIDGELEEFATLIHQSGRRLLDTLNQVLDLAQIEGGHLKPQLQSLPLLDAVRPVLDSVRRLINADGLELEIVEPDEPVVVQADAEALRRVLLCLLSNAQKFTPTGCVTVTVAVENGTGCLRVADTGIGISPDFMPYLFEAFKQESSGIGRNYEGSGLGLTIARRLVEAMHGTIQVTSEPGNGSTFIVCLPLASSQALPRRSTSPADRHPHLLLIEDNAETRTLFRLMLRSHAQLDVAPTSAQAIELLHQNAYDAVFLDIDLGEALSGTDLLRHMRTLPSYDEVPAVACTAYALPGDSTRFLATGFDAYLPKPFTRNDLLNTLQHCLPDQSWA